MKFMQYLGPMLLLSTSLYASNIQIEGSFDQQVRTNTTNVHLKSAPNPYKTIQLLKLKLSPDYKRFLVKQSENNLTDSSVALSPSLTHSTIVIEPRVQLGMNHVDVLDQGSHGTCVIFAVTAALDAAMGQGDYISQVCQLQLGQYLENHAYALSGWEGGFGNSALNQIDLFGFISKNHQRSSGCNGNYNYPTNSSEEGIKPMSPEAFRKLSEHPADFSVFSTKILDLGERNIELDNPESISEEQEDMLIKVKRSLQEGDRVVIGAILIALNQGDAGAIGKKKKSNDTWILNTNLLNQLKRDIADDEFNNIGGHELIVTGYDDEATAVDPQGKVYKGLLTLRNSWGPNAGDNGDYYMTYQYFKTFVDEAFRIRASH